MNEESLKTGFVSLLQNIHLSAGYQGVFRLGKPANLASHFYPTVRMSAAVTLLPGCLHGVQRDDFT
jgi:hypothetical protein